MEEVSRDIDEVIFDWAQGEAILRLVARKEFELPETWVEEWRFYPDRRFNHFVTLTPETGRMMAQEAYRRNHNAYYETVWEEKKDEGKEDQSGSVPGA